MQKRHIVYNIQGMGQDVISSPQNTTMAYSIKNMRLTPTKDSNALELTTERGTELINIEGDSFPDNATVIGYCTLQEYLVLFITAEKIVVSDEWVHGPDYIYRLEKTSNGYTNKLLFEGDLNFDVNSDIEATSYFENTKIQKIYWVDGINQPRLINIYGKEDDPSFDISTDTPTFPITDFDPDHQIHTEFDFLQEVLQTSSSARIKAKKTYTGGNFTSGVILYAYSLYKNNSQETPIIDATSLLYITHSDRGGAPNKQCGCSFEITIENRLLKNDFDYIRLYSILRNSLNGTPLARVVSDIPFAEEVTVIDDGNGGYDYDYNQLQYQRIPIHPLTLTLKDNVLFMGNYDVEYNINDLSKLYDKGLLINCDNWDVTPDLNHWDSIYGVSVYDPNDISVYPWLNQLDTESAGVKTFKYGETYKLGVQFLDKYGNWSLPYFIMDKQQTVHPYIDTNGYLRKPIFYCDVNDIYDSLSQIEKDNYVRIRPVVSLPSITERSVLCQGVLNPTVFNITERCNKTCYAQSSWFFRPFIPDLFFHDQNTKYGNLSYGAILNYHHHDSLNSSVDIGGEILGMYFDSSNLNIVGPIRQYISEDFNDTYIESKYKNFYYIDQSVLTLNSVDLENNIGLSSIDLDNYNINIIGIIPVNSTIGKYKLISENPLPFNDIFSYRHGVSGWFDPNETYMRGDKFPYGFYSYILNNQISFDNDKNGILCSLNCWFDDISDINKWSDHTLHPTWNTNRIQVSYYVHPWQRQFLNNYNHGSHLITGLQDDHYGAYIDSESGKITNKILANIRYSQNNIYISNLNNLFTLNVNKKYYYKDSLIKLSNTKLYSGNINQYYTYDSLYRGFALDVDTAGSTEYWTSRDAEVSGYPIIVQGKNRSFTDNTYNEIFDYRINDSIPREFADIEALATGVTTPSGSNLDRLISSNCKSNDPILISYKSSPHIVFQLNKDLNNRLIIIPSIEKLLSNKNDSDFTTLLSNNSWIREYTKTNFTNYIPWEDTNYDDNLDGYRLDLLLLNDFLNNDKSYLLLSSLFKQFDLDDYGYPINSYLNRWNTEDDPSNPYLENISNLYLRNWIPAGKAQQFVKIPGSTTNTIAWIEGDTYYQRYDCVKTKPYSDESYQSVIEILSFMVESNINLDGRYDKNRGILDYTIISDDNFNLFNDVYNQENNFFTYHILDPAKFNVDEFRNDIVWSAKKISGESIDQWTKLSSVNQLQLNGNKGYVKALRKFNDNIYCFQDHAISRIRFNDRTAIATESGEPLQLAYTNYVDGYEYVNSDIGCQYGISCCETENGIFFIDNDIPSIYKMSYNEYGNANVRSLTKERFMQRWFENYGNFPKVRVLFDKPVNEILSLKDIDDNGYCISFSCDMNSFQQFIDYSKARYILTHNNWPVGITNINGDVELWKLRESNYFSSFFGTDGYPYGLQFIASPPRASDGLVLDCIYDNLQYKADMFVNPNGDDVLNEDAYQYEPNESFDTLDVYSIYQDGQSTLNYTNQPHHSISNLRKKFGSWFARIPRFNASLSTGRYNRERMRGSRLMINLMKNNQDLHNNKLVLKELSVDCFY